MVAVLADAGDGCRVSRSVAKVTTVGSVVFEPASRRLWMASDGALTSHGTFVALSLDGACHERALGTIDGTAGHDRVAQAAFERYREAYNAYPVDGDIDRACDEMASTTELAPGETLYHGLRSLLELARADGDAAGQAFDRALARSHVDPERETSLHFWQGCAHDLAGRRGDRRLSRRPGAPRRCRGPSRGTARPAAALRGGCSSTPRSRRSRSREPRALRARPRDAARRDQR
jgi:hypothetical protein